MPQILLVGNDPWLLKTRALLLKQTKAEVLMSDPYELEQNGANQQFNLVILCHSLDDASRLYVSTEAHRRWSRVRIMQVVADRYGGNAADLYADDTVLSCNPAELIEHARTLLNDAARCLAA